MNSGDDEDDDEDDDDAESWRQQSPSYCSSWSSRNTRGGEGTGERASGKEAVGSAAQASPRVPRRARPSSFFLAFSLSFLSFFLSFFNSHCSYGESRNAYGSSLAVHGSTTCLFDHTSHSVCGLDWHARATARGRGGRRRKRRRACVRGLIERIAE